mmetsp:Transcript_40663/g.63897  ORF Transcript_40663/g.63897 Transcript_40663/m.63897 type:complete len:531 (-) Transcript_40663:127-1719(-)
MVPMAWLLSCLALVELWSFPQGTWSLNSSDCDGAALLQLQALAGPGQQGFHLAAPGVTCDASCGSLPCNKDAMSLLFRKFFMDEALYASRGTACNGFAQWGNPYPAVQSNNFCNAVADSIRQNPSQIRCDLVSSGQNFCFCDGTTTTTTLAPGQWHLSPFGEPCNNVCGLGLCDQEKMGEINSLEAMQQVLSDNFGVTTPCSFRGSRNEGVPTYYPATAGCAHLSPTAQVLCEGGGFGNQLCYCKAATTTSTTRIGQLDGDPHIHSLRGEHYTLLRRGNFLAWNFSKVSEPAEVQLFASYSGQGRLFTAQALLLKNRKRAMEITAKNCTWHDTRWHPSKQWLPRVKWETTEFQVQVPERVNGYLFMKSGITVNIKDINGKRKLAQLVTHCKPYGHLDFKIIMFDKSDLDYVGGELGAAPQAPQADAKDYYSFVSLKPRMKMKADPEFEVAPWRTLGGTLAAAAFLKDKEPDSVEVSFMSKCGEKEEREAERLCQKHLNRLEDELFSDCIYDVCHGGGEQAAESLAALISA